MVNDSEEEEAHKGHSESAGREEKKKVRGVVRKRKSRYSREEECAETKPSQWKGRSCSTMVWPVHCRCSGF